MQPLSNPPSNPCFGCGPEHERGLNLAFERGEDDDGAFVATTYTPAEDEIGWPGFLHGGLHYTVLYEASYWAALTLGPHLMTARGELVFDERIVPRVGRSFEARGRLLDVEAPREGGGGEADADAADLDLATEGRYRIRAESRGEEGRLLGRLTSTWRPVRRETLERAGIELPDYLDRELAP